MVALTRQRILEVRYKKYTVVDFVAGYIVGHSRA